MRTWLLGCLARKTMQRGNDATSPRPRVRPTHWHRAVGKHLRELHGRFFLQPPTLKPESEYELLALFARNELSACLPLPLLAVLFSLASIFWAPVPEVSAWLAIAIFVKLLMVAACLRFRAEPRGQTRLDAWRNTFVW